MKSLEELKVRGRKRLIGLTCARKTRRNRARSGGMATCGIAAGAPCLAAFIEECQEGAKPCTCNADRLFGSLQHGLWRM